MKLYPRYATLQDEREPIHDFHGVKGFGVSIVHLQKATGIPSKAISLERLSSVLTEPLHSLTCNIGLCHLVSIG